MLHLSISLSSGRKLAILALFVCKRRQLQQRIPVATCSSRFQVSSDQSGCELRAARTVGIEDVGMAPFTTYPFLPLNGRLQRLERRGAGRVAHEQHVQQAWIAYRFSRKRICRNEMF